MNRQEVLEGFGTLSPQDRIFVEAELIRAARFEDAPGMASAMATTIALIERIKAGEDPLRACHEMLDEMAGMCCD